jgi:hypothetical protein
LFYQDPVPIRITYRGMTVVVGDGPTHANNQTYFMQQSDVFHANFTQNSLKLHANFSFSAMLVDLLFLIRVLVQTYRCTSHHLLW